jgi:hypothetical protein
MRPFLMAALLVGALLSLVLPAGVCRAASNQSVYTFLVIDQNNQPVGDALVTVTYQKIESDDPDLSNYSGVTVSGVSGEDGQAQLVLLDMGEEGLLQFDRQSYAFGPAGYHGSLVAEVACQRRGYEPMVISVGQEPPVEVTFPRVNGEALVFKMHRSPLSILKVSWALLSAIIFFLAVVSIPATRKKGWVLLAVIVLIAGSAYMFYENYKYHRQMEFVAKDMQSRVSELQQKTEKEGDKSLSQQMVEDNGLVNATAELARSVVEKFMSCWIKHDSAGALQLVGSNFIAKYGGLDSAGAYFSNNATSKVLAYHILSVTKLHSDGEAMVMSARVLTVWVDRDAGKLGEAENSFEVRVVPTTAQTVIEDLLEEKPEMKSLGQEGIDKYLQKGEFDIVQ